MKKHMFLTTIVLVGLFLFAFVPSVFAETVPNPIVTGPVAVTAAPGDTSHDYVYFTPMEDLSAYGYVEEEFFIEGLANRYDTTSGTDGTIISSDHTYRTRIVVRRPKNNRRFNGVVILEWQNVSAGYELDAHWAPSWKHFMQKGYAWVGVSAQRVGVHGNDINAVDNGLVDWSPTRYGTLDVTDGGTVTDDSLCYDIYSQAAQAVKSPIGIDPMGGLEVEIIIAAGASQSASRLSTYHNSIHPLHEIFDGYYLLVGGAGLRTDLNVKVFQYLSETDLSMIFGGPFRRMADSDHFKSWEVTGTGHSSYVSSVYRDPIVIREFGEEPWPPECSNPPYSRARGQFVIDIQYDHLVRWIKDDIAPPTAPKILFSDSYPPEMMRDEFGIAIGGIRLPDVDVPIALNTGVNFPITDPNIGPYNPFCVLYGTYLPFEDSLLGELYPSHGRYVRKVVESALANRKAGYITKKAFWQFIFEAAHSDIGKKKSKWKKKNRKSHR